MKISRKKFLQICQTVIAGGSILGVSGFILRKNYLLQKSSHVNSQPARANTAGAGWQHDIFTSPYKQVSSFSVPDPVESFDMAGENLIVATSNHIYVYDPSGSLLNVFDVGNNLRDIAAGHEHIYLLFPSRVEVCNHNGEWLRAWEAPDYLSDTNTAAVADFCSMTVARNFLFATDAANKCICKFTTEGNFVKSFKSPNGFVIPSYSFGITCTEGVIYCSNAGRHQVEKYSPDGDYLGAFGKAGDAEGMFCGCCNPVHITNTSSGDIITSEKGNPRISCYNTKGEFRGMLLDSKILGGGNTAYHVKIHEDKLLVAGGNRIVTYQYDKTSVAKSTCSVCGAECPLRSS